MIDEFRGEYFFLSNFYESPIIFEGLEYKNNEAAFQSAKVLDLNIRKEFTTLDPRSAKRKGRRVQLREDWENVKFDIMHQIVKSKFTQNTDLAKKLINTDNEELVEGNTWHDYIWGVCNGKGQNNLGKILMRVREELKEEMFIIG